MFFFSCFFFLLSSFYQMQPQFIVEQRTNGCNSYLSVCSGSRLDYIAYCMCSVCASSTILFLFVYWRKKKFPLIFPSNMILCTRNSDGSWFHGHSFSFGGNSSITRTYVWAQLMYWIKLTKSNIDVSVK